jgi:hypothetical protein
MLFRNFSNWRYYLSPIATISVWQSPFHNGLLLAAIELGIGAIRVEWKKLGIELDEQHAEGIWGNRWGVLTQNSDLGSYNWYPSLPVYYYQIYSRYKALPVPGHTGTLLPVAADDHPVGPTVSLASARPIHFLLEVIRWRRAWPIIFVLQVIRSSRGVNNPRGLSTCLTPSRCPWKSLMKGFEGLPCYQLLRPTGPLHQHLLTSDITRRWWSSL